MDGYMIAIMLACFFLLIKPFRYFLNLFLGNDQPLLYKFSHIIGLVILILFIMLIIDDLTLQPIQKLASNQNAALYLVSPLMMVLAIYMTSLFLFAKEFLLLVKKYKPVIVPVLLFTSVFSIMELINKSSELFSTLGGTPEQPGSTIHELPWINAYTTSLFFNGHLFIFLTSLTILCAYPFLSQKEARDYTIN
ncbi:hypothetical protein ACFYKX_18045 [Cytobacillus sp. FJAT-54145]|uniref:Uncharacterized protein n=1 Tax=Cytobacillus spartinae TaxID=3299023 RepID=A0ABW6KG09_9BACI